MPRSYRHIQEYEKEIIELKNNGYTSRQICEKFGFSKKQYENFITRYNKKQDKIDALKYILTRKDARIKTLEMENELMRDFLSLIERK